MNHQLASMRLLRKHLKDHPCLENYYDTAKYIINSFRLPAFYEVSDRCNLKCEGCYYFDADTFQPNLSVRRDYDAQWNNFLGNEVIKGVTMPYFLGAEPALEQHRLIVASNHFNRGNIGTNGSIFLNPEIKFRISISAWSASESDDIRLRGKSALLQALKLYQGDPRAIVLYTINSQNIAQAKDIAHLCQDHGLPVTFNLWSPTKKLIEKLNNYTGNDNNFFRISTPDTSLRFSNDDLLQVQDTIGQLIEDYPDTVIYSHAYNKWSTTPGPLYKLDSGNVAENCGSRIGGQFKYYGMDLASKPIKCCTAAIDCNECRLYSGGMSSHFLPLPEQIDSLEGFLDWLDIILTIGRIFLRPETDPKAFTSKLDRSSIIKAARKVILQ
ncbi:hypothetical protein [Rheinheimera mangrovi]|uniref:hypothetical protein n=1 Tax=Rheinheimera mangrovi TaxID=2498451 RepID=UPI000F8D42C4|nr:hypothetical protein [Rheinheimera mangrovi]